MKGIVFNIERYSTEDGPGIRSVVFFKGCPLRCEWCASPESQLKKPQIIHYSNKCVLCGKCIEACPKNAISLHEEFGLYTNQIKCNSCGVCIDACFYGAREFAGLEMSVQDVMDEVQRDSDFYKESGGGVTFSGGEPLFQPEFLLALIKECNMRGIHTAIETSLFADKETVIRVLEGINLVYADIKHIDSTLHKKHTNVGNEIILQNIKTLDEMGKDIIIRIPYVPGINDQLDTHRRIYAWASRLKNLIHIEVLPYHRYGLHKYRGIGRQYGLRHIEPVKKEELSFLMDLGSEYDIIVCIGSK